MADYLEGKRIVITGASSGIGESLALQAARARARLVITARRADRLERVAEEGRKSGAQIEVVAADLSSESGCREMIDTAAARLGGIDGLVLNAGMASNTRVDEVKNPLVFAEVMSTNFLGPVYCAWRALPLLKESKGRIVVVSSLQGKTGFPRFAAYSASKHALHGFFDSLRSEIVDDGVRITIACPGPVATPFPDGRRGDEPGMMSVERCAAIILDGMRRGRREIIMTAPGKLGAWLRPFAPDLIDRYVRRRLGQFFERE